ncbi:TPA: divergent polysaccharide deacetylase family protein [Campylobacter coli]|uniref:divergent polysaccharide deacetylase family protein n=1 Tax=Campylobacter coli TaxID=195 RepID=UPI00092E4B0A|nr:divergent polysaccharide deacetylase family protein [Campylobacter coli]EAI9960865.1 divergent polysaccharide deacetylase family protein [Campylobacter coli]EAJ2845909.1 divergent polysaccharide deacetylase family protein [Campylobacter coli]EII8776025.1 divergent polysaccharide deacetylase family protein [Campylobacter coli]HEB7553417.1 divergent polysaccharide deacetylase family protein [Campylobacter coli]HEB7556374.1 divergent polysaccharide deacetylase family protein [Campylobacter col
MSKKLIQIKRYLIIAILFLICVILFLGILIQYQDSQNALKFAQNSSKNITIEPKQENISNENHLGIFKEIPYKDENDNFQENNQSILEEQIKDLNLSSIIDQNLSKIDENLSLVVEQNLSKEENLTKDMNLSKTKQARLAIIIDDMANISQVKALQALKLKLIPSFFPPDKNHIDTPKLALKFDFYMVHLPLAAMNYTRPELDTLNPSDSEKRIFKKIQQVKKDFKDLKFINNHTGSLFTSDEKAMKKLYKAFEKEELIFVDSKTIASSKAPKVAKALGQIYIQRDVFLDNRDDVAYIKKQLMEAVRLAKQKGFAIAIGHPRKNTFKALEQSKDLLKSVELVYLSEIYAK